MAKLKHFLVVLLTSIAFAGSTLAAENAPAENAAEFYNRHIQEAETLKQEAERQIRYADAAKKYRELVDKAVQWETEGLDRYGYESPDLPRLGDDAYFKSKALTKYAEYLTLDYSQQIDVTNDPYENFSLLQEWNDKAFDYVGEVFNDTWDERVVNYRDVMDELSQAFGTELYSIGGWDFDIPIQRRPGVARQILNALDNKMRQEVDPEWRFELLRDRIEKTDWVLKTAHSNPTFDERSIANLGGKGLGESKILQEQSITLIRDLKDLIDKESDPPTKGQLAEKLVEIVKWLKEKWNSSAYDDYYRPDMSGWPDSIEDILGEPTLPIGPRLPSGRTTTPQEPATVAKQCDFDGFIRCRDTFNLQGCIDACPFVAADCPPGTPPDTDCKQTDQKCSDTCWDQGTSHGSQCAIQNHCTLQEIDSSLRSQ
ncbi:MAG: hypothetical protein A3A65_00210 [Candidatus Chisholmbacteria bacterium RIFCSPLOWO2_01_FULL_49_14]|uniref:Kazal-like domain-containing protein n=1 Tax=Candidatus Chisholmbacteria bacterium RIFCSPLOWO2_01_FULL_49_14 TaxID=1797593 RepID=A0A1G1W1H1_9BACT|nr:MAG: hypothetical protein A3A65_00210 [Candidatus Chisholmbacteria bacterium RIFCSPLOWO2_01_FULL_49_14]